MSPEISRFIDKLVKNRKLSWMCGYVIYQYFIALSCLAKGGSSDLCQTIL